MPTTTASMVDVQGCYMVPPDITVIDRGSGTVQIGTEAPRRALLTQAPARAVEILTTLNGTVSLAEAVASVGGDIGHWASIIHQLVDADLLEPVVHRAPHSGELNPERRTLVHRHGTRVAEQILAARADAFVVIEGHLSLAETMIDVLAAAGVGRLHHRGRDRSATGSPLPNTPRSGDRPRTPRTAPSMVVLAGLGPANPSRAAELVTSMVPHLIVEVNHARTIVGPLVLPGRTVCLNCLDRLHRDADHQWPTVAAALRRAALTPAALPCRIAADSAAGQVLDFLDHRIAPATVDATVQRTHGSLAFYRRRWSQHPGCGCHLIGNRP